MSENTTWKQDAAKVLNALAKHEEQPPIAGSANCSAFEAVDATSDEQYFTVGIWLTLEAAIAALRDCGDNYPGETLDEEVKIIEVRERKIGVLDWSETGKVVARFKWERRFDEEVTEWRVTETLNVPDHRQPPGNTEGAITSPPARG